MNVPKVVSTNQTLRISLSIILGWLEPLLDPIARNRKASVVPLIEIIDDSTFEFHVTAIDSIQVGGFDWNLIFNWHVPPANEMKRRKARTDPIRYAILPQIHC